VEIVLAILGVAAGCAAAVGGGYYLMKKYSPKS